MSAPAPAFNFLAKPTEPARRVLWRAFRDRAGRLGILGALAMMSGLAEAATMGLIVTLVGALGAGKVSVTATLPVIELAITLRIIDLLMMCLAMVLARAGLQTVEAVAETRIVTSYEAELRRRIFGAFCDASWPVQARESLGRVQSALNESISQARATLKALAQAIVNLTNFMILAAVAFAIAPLAVLVLAGVASVLFFAIRPIDVSGKRLGLKKAALNVDFASSVNEGVLMAQEVRVFRATERVKAAVNALIGKVRRNRARSDFLSLMVGVLYQNGALLVVVSGLWVVYATGSGQLAQLGVVALLLVRALAFSQGFQTQMHYVAERVAFIEQLDQIEKDYERPVEPPGLLKLDRLDSLELRSIGFGYQPGKFVLEEVSASIARGEAIGIVGPSGAGKSTLIQLLLRLREPVSGQLLANGKPAGQYTLDTWYRQVSFVPQEPRLINDTVAENIRFYRPELTTADIESAAQMAGIHDEISKMAAGYQTPAGERGGALSGGQKQRLCIARALASKPDALIFDEPTSSLDVHSESRIFDSLQALKGKVTLFIIAHRLSTLGICDKVMVIRDGRLQAFDAPDVLAQTNPYYAEALKLAQIR